MFFFILFILAPIVEILVIVEVAGQIGFLNTVALLVVAILLGSWLIKYAGLRTFSRFGQQVRAGQVPTRELADGVCLLLAGLLLIAPGFISDAVALLLIFPPTRALARRWLMSRKSLGGLGRVRVIRATYNGPESANRDVIDAESSESTDSTGSTETRGELDR